MAQRQNKPLPRGRFITFEGIDGCGKTTQARLLAQQLRSQGHQVLETREPGGTAIGSALRSVLLDPAHGPMIAPCELLLYLADRVQHLAEIILPALARGETVICDRYHDATVAYQHHGRGLDFGPLTPWIEKEIAPHPPDVTFWLDVAVETAAVRITSRAGSGAESRIDREQEDFHRRVQAGYAQLAAENPERIVRLDAAQGIEALAGEILNRLGARNGL